MKKKVLLVLLMFMFITNVKALTFNVDVTNIRDNGNNGTMGSISNIDAQNKSLDALFSNVGDEVSFSIIITNSGDRAGTLKSINVTGTNDKIEYTNNLPEGGLAINGNDTNEVVVTAKLKEGAVNGTSTSTIKITYNYDEGSCPEGEILSDDESMCSCPEGKVRNETGICVTPEKPVECKDDEIYNEEKKICEKKVIPVEPEDPVNPEPTPEEPEKEEVKPTPVIPSNPKTLDNIILITLLFIVSGLGIYAVMFKKLKTNKRRLIVGVIIGVLTLSLSFTVLAGVFGIDKLLGAIINPITKKQELIVTVNEKIEFIEVWNGECSIGFYSDDLTPEHIFEGGSGTESDPYTIKTADQLACFASSVNSGHYDYEGQYIKQIKDIKLNDNLIDNIESGDEYYPNVWFSIGNYDFGYNFAGTYDGDNHTISGLYLTERSMNDNSPKGLFGSAINATFKNLVLSDVYIGDIENQGVGALLGIGLSKLTIDNIKTYGTVSSTFASNTGLLDYVGGIVGRFDGYRYNNGIKIENSENNISPIHSGIIGNISYVTNSDSPNIIFNNVTNNGDFTANGGIANYIAGGNSYDDGGYLTFNNVVNHGKLYADYATHHRVGGLVGDVGVIKAEITESGNTGNIISSQDFDEVGGIFGRLKVISGLTVDTCYNSGNISGYYDDSFEDGLTNEETDHDSQYKSFDMGGLIGEVPAHSSDVLIKDSYNTGYLKGFNYYTGGLIGDSSDADGEVASTITIQNSYNEGTISVGYGKVGGLISRTRGIITGSHNSGEITLWGVDREYSATATSPGSTIGGLVGDHGYNTSTSETSGARIINSYNEGNLRITAKTNSVAAGGLCAVCQDITNSTNTGNITSSYATQLFDGLGARVFGTITDSSNQGVITPGTGY